MSLETMTKLATSTVGVGGAATIVFSNIPQNYTDLKIVLSARTAEATVNSAGSVSFSASGDSLYSSTRLYGYYNGGSAIGSDAATGTGNITLGNIDGSNASSDAFTNTHIYVPNYTSSDYKTVYVESCMGSNSTNLIFTTLVSGLWSNTVPITTVLLSGSANWVRYTSATLYGIKNAQKTVGNSIKATGGAIAFDGTYVTHTFNTTSTFTPTTSLVADYLVVAGGGGGGNYVSGNGGGGGGAAGGYRTSLGSTPLSLTATPYTVTVGAGGAVNASGSTSSFSIISSTGGGYGGNNGTPYAGASGGSGGGSIRSDSGITVTGGSGNAGGYSPVEGYAGGSGSGPGGGGGGAGAVGTNSGSGGGNGGIGVANSISGTSTYYAGGGGGAGSTGNTYSAGAGGLGGGGQGGGLNMTPVAGTANTGGGGGGQQFYPNTTTGGAGGSGIVIIRYKG